MYLNDTQRTAFYEGIGLDTKEFDIHVIIEVRGSFQFIALGLDLEREIERELTGL